MVKIVLLILGLSAVFLMSCTADPTPVPTRTPIPRTTDTPPQQAPTDAQGQQPTRGQDQPPAEQATATGRDLPLPPDVLAIYHKSGGFAGIDETLTVYQGGLVELTGRRINGSKSIKLDEPMLQPVRRMLESQDFADLQERYLATGADQFTYSISARDRDGNMKTVVAIDGATYPDFLGQLITMFDQMRGLIK